MDKEQVIKALREGATLTHDWFSPDEWMKQTGLLYEFEDGCLCEPDEFWRYRTDESWNTGWMPLPQPPTGDE